MTRFALVLITSALFAQKISNTGNRTTPPTLNSVSPQGIARGTTIEMTVEGFNLAKASAIYFSEPGLQGRILRIKELPDLPDIRLGSNGTPSTIDLGPLPPRNQVTVEVDVDPEAPIGPVRFRLLTPLGTSPEGSFLVEPFYGESNDKEPNDTAENAVEVFLPAILTGVISKPGDVDLFQITVAAGEELVFDNGGPEIGSALMPVISILDAEGQVLHTVQADASRFAHKFAKAGKYYVRVADYQQSGRGSNFYRIKVGSFPIVTSAYPLGVQRGAKRAVEMKGTQVAKQEVAGTPDRGMIDSVEVRPKGAFNTVRLAIGDEPEVDVTTASTTLNVPSTANGVLTPDRATQQFRFRGVKGQPVVLEVNARRLGSKLDSLIEIADAQGKPVPVAIARPVMETALTLRDGDATSRGIRIAAWTGWAPGDYILIGSEVIRVDELPKTPDEDVLFEAFGGQRLTFFGTSNEAHALDQPVYKVQILQPGSKFTPNGLPATTLFARNDDGGPGFGKDSYLVFTPPADGEYVAALSDVRGKVTVESPYRLTIRQPKPDFRLTFSPRNPAVPVGGTVPVTVTARRIDGFNGPVTVSMQGLPAGVKATTAVIPAGQVSTTILLTASADAKLADAAAIQVAGKAGSIERTAAMDQLALLSLMPPPDIHANAETKEVEVEAGGTAEITMSIERHNDFHGRVPVRVSGLPPRVNIEGFGLNGVLINEDENRRSFVVAAAPNAEPGEYLLFIGGNIETRSPQQSAYMAPTPVKLKIKASRNVSAITGAPDRAGAGRQ
jgi:hypothetical protein